MVAGGVALTRRDDGRVVLVDGAFSGEVVEVATTTRHGVERGSILAVVRPSPDRIVPVCPHVADGCGGCDLADLAHDAQVHAKVEMLTDSLVRLGRWYEPRVRPGPVLDPWGFRTTLRVAITNGRAGLRRRASNSVVDLDRCLVAHPRLDELIVEGNFGDASEATLRVGAATGERLVFVAPTGNGVRMPDDVRVVGADELAAGKRAWIHDELVGRRWRISAESFFQTRPDGATALVGVVRELAADVLDADAPEGGAEEDGAQETGVRGDAASRRTLVDAYSGVGLFAGALLAGRRGWRAVTAESSPSSAADARVNLADLDARVRLTKVERFHAPRADLVVADPSRAGLGRVAAKVLAHTRAERIVLVSCDAAAAGRDVALLTALGYRPVESVVVDLFPHTHHVEVVTRFDRM